MQCVATISVLSACGVDDRPLTGSTWAGDVGGTSSTNESTAGSGSVAGQGCNSSVPADAGNVGGASDGQICSQGGTASGGAPGICPDLNSNNVPDNAESLVKNSTFDVGTDNWDFEIAIGLVWNIADACGRSDSGSASVTNQFAGTSGSASVGGANQCILANPGRIYAIMGQVMPATQSFGGFGLEFYSTSDCSGDALVSYNSSVITAATSWQKATVSGAAPDSAHSVAVRAVVAASAPLPANQYASALFDNILVVAL